jgi:3-phosphoshikimate 1-carboxyvinyltransferase
MGAEMDIFEADRRGGEPVGTVSVRRRDLEGIDVGASGVPASVDELPLLAVIATQADGASRLSGAGELRVKESDRITAIVDGLRLMGADISEAEDGFTVRGPSRLKGAQVDSCGDHRIAMTLAIAGLVAEGETVVEGFEAAAVSWPGFADVLVQMGAEVQVL